MTRARALQSYLDNCQPFNWQTWNCCHFTGNWVRQVWGVDPLQGCVMPSSAQACARQLKRSGGLEQLASARLGAQTSATLLRLGDVVMHTLPSGAALGIVIGRQVALLGEEGGLVFEPLQTAGRGWQL